MADPIEYERNASETLPRDVYLPAVTVPPRFERIERVVNDIFDLHGVVLIPDSHDD
ncbi:hypothetical protein ACFQE1_10005 [Halobium palmae]|uniref:Uncharacterized protein n=1 Tax=Halobium palmae TaxID=1776492 RepID=A0ABD5S197_9EURY